MALSLVGIATVRVTLHRGARSRGYKLSREGAGPKSLGWWWWCAVSIAVDSSCCCLIILPLRLLPASPFITSKGRSQVTFAVKW
jgi:hypothetical protein